MTTTPLPSIIAQINEEPERYWWLRNPLTRTVSASCDGFGIYIDLFRSEDQASYDLAEGFVVYPANFDAIRREYEGILSTLDSEDPNLPYLGYCICDRYGHPLEWRPW